MTPVLRSALEATGYLVNGQPAAPTVSLGDDRWRPRLPSFTPDAWWQGGTAEPTTLTVLFKAIENGRVPPVEWHRDVWNLGFAPLLWVVAPDRIGVYNGFAPPRAAPQQGKNLLGEFTHDDDGLSDLNEFAGRLVMETGEFWQRPSPVDRRNGVDRRLLDDLGRLESDLVGAGLDREETQGLIGRTVFSKYLLDREIVTSSHLNGLFGHDDLADLLGDRDATARLYDWLRDEFNGDMFPNTPAAPPRAEHLARVARFLRAEDDGQMSLFPYRFDVIPVELISSIYERFVHSAGAAAERADTGTSKQQGVYYTPLAAVSLVLDEVFDALTGDETVIDLTCGSGMFLVEALRRLVRLKAGDGAPTREMVRSALYDQVFGVDISPAAIRIAAFSLYLAAMELDPDPKDPESRRFEPLVGRTLLAGDAHSIEHTEEGGRLLVADGEVRKFDVVVGNPPWTFRGREGTAARRARGAAGPRAPRGESLDFLRRAVDFAHSGTRFGVLLSAAPFFARSGTGLAAVQGIVERLGPGTLINLSDASHWLFDRANMPAMALLARHRDGRSGTMELVQVRRSREGDRSHTISLGASDVTTLPFASWKRNPSLLKAGLVGCRSDLLLLDDLGRRLEPLGERLEGIGTRLASGFKRGNRAGDASHLAGLPFLPAGSLGRFKVPERLPNVEGRAEHPRDREIYRAPLVMVREAVGGGGRGMADGRCIAAVSERDLVYKDAYWGISFPARDPGVAHLVAGILSSSVASWHALTAGSAFGIWRRVVRRADLDAMPFPDLDKALDTDAGRRVVAHVRSLRARHPTDSEWTTLDEAVFDLYGLDQDQRAIVSDGRKRAACQWKAARNQADEPADREHLVRYAEAFCRSMDEWFHAAGERRLSAEVYDLEAAAPLRIVRFALEDHPPPSRVVESAPRARSLAELIAEVGARLDIPIHNELVGRRELRLHGRREVVIAKPAARRHWLPVSALDDAAAVVATSAASAAP